MSLSLDRECIYIQCPRCNFNARPFLRQVRNQDVMICGGCKANIWLVDYIGQLKKAEREVRKALDSLTKQFRSLDLTIKL